MEHNKILEVIKKNKEFFDERRADIAFGVKRDNIFYVIDEYGELDNICFFQTAEELEKIIASTLIEDIECELSTSIESIGTRFMDSDIKNGEIYVSEKLETYMPVLLEKMKVMIEESEKSNKLMKQLVTSLM